MINSQIIDEIIRDLGREVDLANADLRYEICQTIVDTIALLESGTRLPQFLTRNIMDAALFGTTAEETTTIGRKGLPLPRDFIMPKEEESLVLVDGNVDHFPIKVTPEVLEKKHQEYPATGLPLYYTVASPTPFTPAPAPPPEVSEQTLEVGCLENGGIEEGVTPLAFKTTLVVSNTSLSARTINVLFNSLGAEPVKVLVQEDATETPWLGDVANQAALDAAVAGTEVSTDTVVLPSAVGVLPVNFDLFPFDLSQTTVTYTSPTVLDVGESVTFIIYNPLLRQLSVGSSCDGG